MKDRHHNALINVILCITLLASLLIPLEPVYAAKSGRADSEEELMENALARMDLPIQTNEIEGWPAGPAISAEAAVLMEIDTGAILYAKNMDEELYPASITKLMTCLLAAEHGDMTDRVEFSYEAVHSIPADASSMGMDVGESLTLEECLYGIMVGSANEVANAVAEYTAGSIDAFVDMMNERAVSLGCEHTHFVTTNGLHDEEHYTCARDMALIAREFFSNEMLSRIANTTRYHFEPSETQPDDIYLNNHHKLINGEIPYEGIRGGKTGYTGDARRTLVTCAEQQGMSLVCVVMMDENPEQFNDTVTLFNYGYSNFSLVPVSENETRYTPGESGFFKTGSDVFGDSTPFLKISEDSRIVKPVGIDFEDLDTEVDFDAGPGRIARITYSLGGMELGSAYVESVMDAGTDYEFERVPAEDIGDPGGIAIERQDKTVFLNVRVIVTIIIIVAVTLCLVIVVVRSLKNYHFNRRRSTRKGRRRHYYR